MTGRVVQGENPNTFQHISRHFFPFSPLAKSDRLLHHKPQDLTRS